MARSWQKPRRTKCPGSKTREDFQRVVTLARLLRDRVRQGQQRDRWIWQRGSSWNPA